jgi:hypothetical protein
VHGGVAHAVNAPKVAHVARSKVAGVTKSAGGAAAVGAKAAAGGAAVLSVKASAGGKAVVGAKPAARKASPSAKRGKTALPKTT